MHDIEKKLTAALASPKYAPLKPRALARKLGYDKRYDEFKVVLKAMLHGGAAVLAKNNTVRPVTGQNTVAGVFRKASSGIGFVRPHPVEGKIGEEIYIAPHAQGDASTGDTVLARIGKMTARGPRGEIIKVLERNTRSFVGTYFEREGNGYVRVDGTVFAHSIFVGDPGVKGSKPDDKVVLEMIRFPSADNRGEGVIAEILGPRGQPGVDTLSIIRALGLPDAFPEDALAEARMSAAEFDENQLKGREDFTRDLVITVDPADARDHDDAVCLTVDPKSKHWQLSVHIADVSHFAPLGSALDREARKRATSIYLPQRVIPMFPEILSNGLASLQQGKLRYTKSAIIDFTPTGQVADIRFANGAIRVKRRFAYEQVRDILAAADKGDSAPTLGISEEMFTMLVKMRELAQILHKRRLKRGSLQLHMPEIGLEYDAEGRVSGAHFRQHDISHQIIEEFMLAANEAVAQRLDDKSVPFLRRVHPAPDPAKLKAFAEFIRILGYKIKHETDRFALQRVLDQSSSRPDQHAVHYAMLRSLKQATYSPVEEGHYALASENYCHFTSPIRRYPDLVVHRLLDQLLRRGKAGSDYDELVILGDHCSKMERRAELAERELVKYKLLVYMSDRLGTEMNGIITGVADYGFYAQAEEMPVEGLVHISTLPGDYYYYDEPSHSLAGQKFGRRFRLGDKVRVKVIRVDLGRRQMDLRVVVPKEEQRREEAEAKREPRQKPRRRRP